MKTLERIDRAIARLEGWLIVALLGLMVALTFLQVALRALYTHAHLQWANNLIGSLGWSEIFVRLLVLWLTFLGASLLSRKGRHIKIDIFTNLLPPRWRCVQQSVLALISAAICMVMIKTCFEYLRMEMKFGGVLFFALPTWAGQVILPVGFSLISFRFLLRAFDQASRIIRGGHP
jgi:TRAP-type C4-dicarboxylate transport system permease small subunit